MSSYDRDGSWSWLKTSWHHMLEETLCLQLVGAYSLMSGVLYHMVELRIPSHERTVVGRREADKIILSLQAFDFYSFFYFYIYNNFR